MEHVRTGDTVRFGAVTHNPSGGALIDADATPRWFVFEEASDTPIQDGEFTKRTGLDGTYRSSVVASKANGFDDGSFYEIHASGTVAGVEGRAIIKTFVLDDIFNANVLAIESGDVTGFADVVWDAPQSDHQSAGSFGESNQTIYYADIKHYKDSTAVEDEYGICWFKNTSVVTSGQITNPAMSVYKGDTGVAVFENKILTYISPDLGTLQHTHTTVGEQLESGVPYLVMTSGTIDSANREWKNIVGIDIIL